jgi:hypothetical protein
MRGSRISLSLPGPAGPASYPLPGEETAEGPYGAEDRPYGAKDGDRGARALRRSPRMTLSRRDDSHAATWPARALSLRSVSGRPGAGSNPGGSSLAEKVFPGAMLRQIAPPDWH